MSKALMKELVGRWKIRRATVQKLYDEAMERHDIPGALRLQSRMNELTACIKNLDGLADQVEEAGTPVISNLPARTVFIPAPDFFCREGGPGCPVQCKRCRDQERHDYGHDYTPNE